MGKFGAHLSPSESRHIFHLMDNDRDGKISFQEFLFEYERKSSLNKENKGNSEKNEENKENREKIEEILDEKTIHRATQVRKEDAGFRGPGGGFENVFFGV